MAVRVSETSDDARGTARPIEPKGDVPAGLTPTGRVILGMLALGKGTGYDIKQFVDKSTRHFWAASYGQIYPELRRLEQQGLIRGRPEPTGGRARARSMSSPVPAPRRCATGSERPTNRCTRCATKGLLKLFFSDALPEQRIEIVRAVRKRMERKLAQLDALGAPGKTGPALTLSLGRELTRHYIDWCEATERRLAEEE